MNMNESKPAKLTEGQQKVLDYILMRQHQDGISPSTREIQKALNLGSQNSALQFLASLKRKGAIRSLPGKARGIAAIVPPISLKLREDGRPLFIDVPIRGEITAGLPVDAPPQVGDVLPVHAVSMGLTAASKPFALRVHGDSMTGACIRSGDYVVLDATREARPGDVVAALLDGETTLKRYVVCGGRPFLKAENVAYPDLTPVRELEIQGVMVGLVRGQSCNVEK